MNKQWGAAITGIVTATMLAGCGGGSGSTGGSSAGSGTSSSSTIRASSTLQASTSSAADLKPSAVSCPTPAFPPKATEPTGITGNDDAAAARNVENFKSFRLTMDSVVPKSHCMSDVNLLGVAAWVCTKRASGTSELDVAFQIPTIVQRTDKSQPAWDNDDSLAAVDKAETIYCPQYSSAS